MKYIESLDEVKRIEEEEESIEERKNLDKMEVQTQHMMHHNPYAIVKSESPNSPPKSENGRKNNFYPSTDIIFGMQNFNLPNSFCNTNNNNHEPLNNNHVKVNSNAVVARQLAVDRKRPYPCGLCTSRFGSKMELEEHQNSHTGMKPFECDVCKAKFNRRSTLWNHKRIHSDAKPFVCTVCQMTFKWKNSLKCHKEMHLRKNESSAHLDNDLRQLTYATAAKRRLEENGNPATSSASSIHNQPLITTTTPKKKSNKVSLPLFVSNNYNKQSSPAHTHSQPLQASSLMPPTDHHLEMDTSSLDSLVQHTNNNNNIIMQLYGDPRNATTMLSGLDDPSMLSSQLLGDLQNDSMNNSQLNVHLPIHQINMLNFRPINTQQLPSVHHLTSTSLPSVIGGNMDYGIHSDNNNLSHPQYIVATQPDMMISQQYSGQQFNLNDCVILTTGGQDYLPNYDFNMSNYQIAPQEEENQQTMEQQQQEIVDGKIVPSYEW